MFRDRVRNMKSRHRYAQSSTTSDDTVQRFVSPWTRLVIGFSRKIGCKNINSILRSYKVQKTTLTLESLRTRENSRRHSGVRHEIFVFLRFPDDPSGLATEGRYPSFWFLSTTRHGGEAEFRSGQGSSSSGAADDSNKSRSRALCARQNTEQKQSLNTGPLG